MAQYEYRCRTCDDRFEMRRPMSDADAPAACPAGHGDVVRLLSVFATVGASSVPSSSFGGEAPAMGGGCGGSCACHG